MLSGSIQGARCWSSGLFPDSRLSAIHLLDFPDKKANLRLAVLNIFGGCAMLGLCAQYINRRPLTRVQGFL